MELHLSLIDLSFQLRNDLYTRLDRVAKRRGRGFKQILLNEMLEALLDGLEKQE
ncbi:hypothetical protein [Domibacillus tundrae]|uniref:hypothetical protein n=1 Tax=Domibacillus tundrae TaxID=1587527 RepID=UPI0012E05222|nr:hypothetical protein [Domibacillus tundrae]